MVIKVKNNGEWVKIPYLSSDNNPIIPEAPLDGKQYARQSGEWTVVNIPEVDFTEINQKISQNTAAIAANTTAIQSKVDKVDGFGLSSNDYTSQEKTKLAGLNNYTLPTASDTVKGGIKVGTGLTMNGEVLSATVDLSGYATTAAMNSALGNKVDKVSGKALSTNDYTTAEKNKLAGIAASANNYSLPAATSSVLGGVKTSTGITNSSGTISVTYGTAAGTACQGNDSRLSNSRPASDVSAWAKASTKPTYTWTEITSKPSWIGSSKPTYTASEVGALASGGTAVNASKVANSFIFKVAGGSTEGTNLYTFNGSAAKTINVVAGSNVTLTPTAGQLSISAKDTTYAVATTSANGLMSSAMVTKLNGVATNANNYSLPTATGSVLGGVKTGSNITNSSGTISLSSGNVTNALGYTPVKNESGVASIRVMTQSAYDALSSKSATTLYIITG